MIGVDGAFYNLSKWKRSGVFLVEPSVKLSLSGSDGRVAPSDESSRRCILVLRRGDQCHLFSGFPCVHIPSKSECESDTLHSHAEPPLTYKNPSIPFISPILNSGKHPLKSERVSSERK